MIDGEMLCARYLRCLGLLGIQSRSEGSIYHRVLEKLGMPGLEGSD